MNATHDDKYLTYLRKTFGTKTLPLFGIMITLIGFIFVCIVTLMNVQLSQCKNQEKKKLVDWFFSDPLVVPQQQNGI